MATKNSPTDTPGPGPIPAQMPDDALAERLRALAAILTNAPHRALVLEAARRVAADA